MFKTRLLSGIVLVIIALVTLILGGPVLYALLLVISIIGMRELFKIFQMENKLMGIVSYAGAISYYVLILFKDRLPGEASDWVMGLFLLILILLMAVMVLAYPDYVPVQVLAGFFAIFYVAVMLSFIYQTRQLEGGIFTVWLVFICAWGCDTCAYCSGMLLGKHKLAPVLSPKKSIEGAIGGVVGAALIGLIYAICINKFAGAEVKVVIFVIISAVGACISQIGDLGASAIKRRYNIKDYGTLIPGHGGILDRFDSVIFTAPIIYFLAVILGSVM